LKTAKLKNRSAHSECMLVVCECTCMHTCESTMCEYVPISVCACIKGGINSCCT
jgi:hypothetical protein